MVVVDTWQSIIIIFTFTLLYFIRKDLIWYILIHIADSTKRYIYITNENNKFKTYNTMTKKNVLKTNCCTTSLYNNSIIRDIYIIYMICMVIYESDMCDCVWLGLGLGLDSIRFYALYIRDSFSLSNNFVLIDRVQYRYNIIFSLTIHPWLSHSKL